LLSYRTVCLLVPSDNQIHIPHPASYSGTVEYTWPSPVHLAVMFANSCISPCIRAMHQYRDWRVPERCYTQAVSPCKNGGDWKCKSC